MKKQMILAVVALSLVFGSVHALAQTPAYHANLLGISDGRTNIQIEHAYGLNRWGQVIGTYGGGLSGGIHAVLWTPPSANDGSGNGISGTGTFFSIESTPGLPPGTAWSTPDGLSDRGQIAGTAYTPGHGDGNQTQSWMWRPNALNSPKGVFHCCNAKAVTFPLVSIPGFGALAEYNDRINNNGVIAAYGINAHPLLWNPTVKNGLIGTWTYEQTHGAPPSGINDAGQITGSSCESGVWNGPYLHSGGFPLVDTDPISSPLWLQPGTPNCVGGAGGLNQQGDLAVSAVSATQNNILAYLYKNGAATDLSAGEPSQALAINNYDQVVGSATTDTNRATLFENGLPIDLNTLNDSTGGLQLKTAIAINDAGQILCSGVYPGAAAVILLTPNALVITPVTVTKGKLQHTGSTYTQTVTVTNGGTTTITGPISVALDALTSGVTLTNATGTTAYAGLGSPYADVSTSDLAAGATTAAFTLVFNNPGHVAVKYATRVLAGPAPR
jgi:hypothetical protein